MCNRVELKKNAKNNLLGCMGLGGSYATGYGIHLGSSQCLF